MSRSAHIEEQAAEWLMRRDSGEWSRDREAELQSWLDASPEHEVAFLRLEHVWDRADRLAALRPAPSPIEYESSLTRWKPWAIAASLAVAVVSGVLATGGVTLDRGDRFATAVGVQSRIPLPDGSRIELNTDTELRADIDGGRRFVQLEKGEAYFDVEHDPSRPFQVRAGDSRITVLGTKFTVRRTDDEVRVAVVEGKVKVETLGEQAPSARVLSAGEIALVGPRAELATAQSPDRVAGELSWRQGMLAFDHDSLADAAAEFNRYNEKKLVVASPKLRDMTISGRFEAANVEAFVRLLHKAYGIEIADEGDQLVIS